MAFVIDYAWVMVSLQALTLTKEQPRPASVVMTHVSEARSSCEGSSVAAL